MVDMLIWDTAVHGENSARRLLRELKDSPVHDLIDQTTVDWTIATVRHRLAGGVS